MEKKATKASACGSDICVVSYVDQNKVLSVLQGMKSESVMQRIAETFKVLGDPTRTKIVYALSNAELCVCDLASLLAATRSAISHQLRILRNMRLVKYRKEGKMVFYSLDDGHIWNLFNECLRHIEEEEYDRHDRRTS
ncbi:MAG: metalloregulator ArsR/SmtB family transcription factor [Alphaproteobacteria bacterium]|uniref:Metalloregulator ArsR/SmtB family transcription factor n=1 Tax=Candidatus Nitrobium versatile TaxID=2884831 RepID=A0A953JCB7_9BACT|nr:metalloregulator ArsR/SmtB family transcription factor [Candidatus Nitrobium versatile]